MAVSGDGDPAVLPDTGLCESCRGELFDPNNRRYRYPFISCAGCGPRSSILYAWPYQRGNTSMRGFTMCTACQREYYDPFDRRFHAADIGCPACGPHVALWDASGRVVAERDAAMAAAANAIRAGQIVVVKDRGGFRMVADAADERAVRRLPVVTSGDEPPRAILCPDLECVHQHAHIGQEEARWLVSPEAPIVIVRPRPGAQHLLAPSAVADGHELAVQLAATPLSVLLMRDVRRPVVVTRGDRGGDPVCIDEREAIDRFSGIADAFLVHNRPLIPRADATVVRRAEAPRGDAAAPSKTQRPHTGSV